MPELDWEGMPIHLAIKSDWRSPEILIEGSLNCAKTTVFLDKEIDALLKYPGIKTLLFRWSQDAVDTKLRPAFEELLGIRGVPAVWEEKKKRWVFENGSIANMFGLKAVSMVEQMNKIRGLGVSRAGGDQVEEVDPAVAGELRGRLRPDLTATTIRKESFPFQITFVSNSEDDDFWLSKEFPPDNHIKGRRLFQLSIFDNKHLPQESIDSLLRQYPEDHPKHRTMVLGRRGPRVYGVPVFEGLYRKDLHWRPCSTRLDRPILEAFEFGKHNPVYVYGQAMYSGGLTVLGGVMGYGLVLEDFLPIVEQCRTEWLPPNITVKTCTSPMGESVEKGSSRFTALNVLRQKIGAVRTIDNGNAADVRIGAIENLSTYLRRRNLQGQESLAVNNEESRFIIASKDGERFSPFVHHAFEGGYTWDAHAASVANKELRQPREDDKFANVMHAIENLELNFIAGRTTASDRAARRQSQRTETRQQEHTDSGKHSWMV